MGAQAHRATKSAKPAEVEHRWYIVDATDQVLGRLSARPTGLSSRSKGVDVSVMVTGSGGS